MATKQAKYEKSYETPTTMTNMEEIKEKIRTINPEITDELLDLLYEYFTIRNIEDIKYLKDDVNFQDLVTNIMMSNLVSK